jgi:hypothetical protein
VDQMIGWCQHGPPGAHVSALEQFDEPPHDPLPGFSIRPTE